MVRRDVREDRDVRTEVADAIELEAGQFEHVQRIVPFGDQSCERGTDVAANRDIEPGLLQDVAGEQCGRCFAVAAGDADNGGLRVARCELDLADHGNALLHRAAYKRGRIWNAGAFHDLARTQHTVRAVSSFLEFDVVSHEHLLVVRLDVAGIAHEHGHATLLREQRCSRSAFLRAQHHQLVHRSLSVTRVSTASITPTIQKRATILLSW